MGGFFGTPESNTTNVCVDCIKRRVAEQKRLTSQAASKPAGSDAFGSSVNAINLLDIVNNIGLWIGIFAASALLILAANNSSGALAIYSGLGFLASFIAWCVIRVMIGMAMDLRVSRDNSDQLLALVREKLTRNDER